MKFKPEETNHVGYKARVAAMNYLIRNVEGSQNVCTSCMVELLVVSYLPAVVLTSRPAVLASSVVIVVE